MYIFLVIRKDKLEFDSFKYSFSSGLNIIFRFIVVYFKLNISSLFDGGVIFDNNVLDVGLNNVW